MRLFQSSPFSCFFKNFLMFLKGLHHFLIFCNKLYFQKAQRVPHFTILKTLRCLNLRYSADFRRSRLVRLILDFLNRCPPIFFFRSIRIFEVIFKVKGYVRYFRVICVLLRCVGSKEVLHLSQHAISYLLKRFPSTKGNLTCFEFFLSFS